MQLRQFEANQTGHDFVVGDIHGCFDVLEKLLYDIGFDKTKDRLFSVGDMVDRGPESYKVMDYLHYPWFKAVRGNHEQMCIDYHGWLGNDTRRALTFQPVYEANGGGWFLAMDADRQANYVAVFHRLPLAIELEVNGKKTGLIHAEVPDDDWNRFKELLSNRHAMIDHLEHYGLWGRGIIRKHRLDALTEDFKGVANIDQVYVGHSVVPDVTKLGNISYVDTGCAFGKKLTVVNMNTGEVHSKERYDG